MKKGRITGVLLVFLFFGFCIAGTAAQAGGFTINATASHYGTISPSGEVQVAEGADQTFVCTPDPDQLNCWGAGKFFVVWQLLVDGEPVDIGPEPSRLPVNYTFTGVEGNHTIHAEFSYALVNAKPTVEFTANPASGRSPLVVNFSQVSVSNHTSVLWSFGDNSTSTGENPQHTYFSPGLYTVSLTIYCDGDSFTERKPDYISVEFPPIGGDKGYFLVHSNVDGAKVFFDDDFKGLTANGTLLVQVYTTATPYRSYTVSKDGYTTFIDRITHYPRRDQTVDLYAVLGPSSAGVNGWVASGSDYGPVSIPGARVRIAKNASDLASPYTSLETTTDARGIYAISGLPTGVPLYADVLAPVNPNPDFCGDGQTCLEKFPNRYYPRPLSYQVSGGSLVIAWNMTSFPRIPALVPNKTTQVNFFLRQNPNAPPQSIIID